jgi:tetratricopeptide (TPR) repeat protein
MGDAAWMSGNLDLAKRRWTRSIALAPSRSWMPYANLALLSAAKSELSASYWARMKSAFLAGPPSDAREGALGAYAAQLALDGREAEALAALQGGLSSSAPSSSSGALAVLELKIRGRSIPEGRYVIELERLAAERPNDAMVMGAVLRELSIRGRYDEVALLREGAARRKLPLENGWFYEAQVLTARGDYSRAASVIRANYSSASSRAEGSFALGSLLGAMGDHVKAAAEYSRAAAAARSAPGRCAAFKALGRELGASADSQGATKAFKAALAADPSDAEAALLARSFSKK